MILRRGRSEPLRISVIKSLGWKSHEISWDFLVRDPASGIALPLLLEPEPGYGEAKIRQGKGQLAELFLVSEGFCVEIQLGVGVSFKCGFCNFLSRLVCPSLLHNSSSRSVQSSLPFP